MIDDMTDDEAPREIRIDLERLAIAATIHYARNDMAALNGVWEQQSEDGIITNGLFQLIAFILHERGVEDPLAYLERLMAWHIEQEGNAGPPA